MRRIALLASLAFPLLATVALAAQPVPATPIAAPVRVKLTTTDGVIVLELRPDRAPITVENFVRYVKDKHFEGTIFHRVIPNFMIQGGGFNTKFEEKKTRAPIKLESINGLTNVRGSIAMARTNERDSATSQFFINTADNSGSNGQQLDVRGGGYAVFGMVVEGIEVVDKIRGIPTGPGGPFSKDVPFRNAMITKAEVLGAPKAAKPAAPVSPKAATEKKL